jgi:hypothetical protein
MFFGSTPDSAPKDEGTSLSSVLPIPTLRVELALVILLCIDSMRNDPYPTAVRCARGTCTEFGIRVGLHRNLNTRVPTCPREMHWFVI